MVGAGGELAVEAEESLLLGGEGLIHNVSGQGLESQESDETRQHWDPWSTGAPLRRGAWVASSGLQRTLMSTLFFWRGFIAVTWSGALSGTSVGAAGCLFGCVEGMNRRGQAFSRR